jgi:ABC-type sulfate transport system substrate-binding protein
VASALFQLFHSAGNARFNLLSVCLTREEEDEEEEEEEADFIYGFLRPTCLAYASSRPVSTYYLFVQWERPDPSAA